MASEDFLQEYAEEVKEHLQELEHSLLALEREGAGREEIQQIFRAAHSIKGASAYMGFEGLAGLTHELESLVSTIQKESRAIPLEGINVMLACVDFISNALKHLQETGMEPALPDSLVENLHSVFSPKTEACAEVEQPEPAATAAQFTEDESASEISAEHSPTQDEPIQPRAGDEEPAGAGSETERIWEEDQELYKIFLKAFSEGLSEFQFTIESSRENELAEIDFEVLRGVLRRLVASSQYMDYERLVDMLEEWEKEIARVCDGGGEVVGRKMLKDQYDSFRQRFQELLPGLEQSLGASPREPEEVESAPPIEEDEELFGIFSSSFRETFAELVKIASGPPETLLSENDYLTSRNLLKRMIQSSQYMDYQEVANSLTEWDESLVGSWNEARTHGRFFADQVNDYGRRLHRMVPGLDLSLPPSRPELPPASEPGIQEEDGELFSIFLESFRELFAELTGLAPSSSEEPFSAEDYERGLRILQRLKSSSQYMDYEEIVDILNELEMRLRNEFLSGMADTSTVSELVWNYGNMLQKVLPGLKVAQEETEAAEEPEDEGIGPGVEAGFDQIDLLITPDEVMPENISPGDLGLGTTLPETTHRDLPQKRDPGTKTDGAQVPEPSKKQSSKRDRIVAVAEEIAPSSTLRVDAQKVDQLLNQVGELVVTRSEFIQTSLSFRDMIREVSAQGRLSKQELRRLRSLSFRLNESTVSLGRVANDLQDSVMRIRMLPISFLFQRFPRVVRDQSLKLGKKVELLLEGGETEIDKRVLEQMNDPIVQFLRNAIVHGIEHPQERTRGTKPETGTIRLAAYHQGDYVALQIEDDGRGIDTQKLRAILQERKELSSHELDRLSDQELMYAIFLPGVSTHDGVDGTAGRGVGLDVVKENVERMNGAIEVESYPGLGTRFTIRIPLTVAIIRALLVKGGPQVFTIPLSSVSEILRYNENSTHTIEGFEVASLRGKTIPLVHIGKLLNAPSNGTENQHKSIVIVSTSFREVGLVVDGLLGEREVVIKPLEDAFSKFEGFSGATILGDGTVSLILDVSALLRMMKDTNDPGPIQGRQVL